MMCKLAPVLVLSCALPACTSGPGGGGGGSETEELLEFACQLAVVGAGGELADATGDARAELNLGFQGFLFVAARVRASGDVPKTAEATTSVTVDGDEPIGAREPELHLQPEGDGFLSDDLLLFFNSEVPADLEGRRAELALRLEDSTRMCTATGSVLLADDDPCIHTGDEPICPDDSGTGATATADSTDTTTQGSVGG